MKKLQVFISSTYSDLKAERQAAVEAILKAGHIPAGMELFTAGDESQLQTIYRWIKSSDVYMLILGGRYGSIEQKTSLSYIELEYDFAVTNGLPFFSIVMTESQLSKRAQSNALAFIEKENPEGLKQFREKVLSKTSSFFDDPKDIKLAVHETLNEFNSRYSLKGWVPGNEVPDPTPLYQEITSLKMERDNLRTNYESVKTEIDAIRSKVADKVTLTFDEIAHIISNITIKTSVYAPQSPPSEYTLFGLYLLYRELFIDGVRDTLKKDNVMNFLYYNLCPKFVVYGLLVRDRMTFSGGFAMDRYIITQKGLDLYAFIDKSNYLKPKA
jgi:hypothetical protein